MTSVEDGGTRVRARLVAYGEHTVAERTPTGVIAIRERWQPGSVTLPGGRLRMLAHHDRRTPVGWWESFAEDELGVVAEGRLVGSRAVLDHVRELIRDDLLSAISIGFVAGDADVWSRPDQKNGLPIVTRRGVGLREASIVDAAAVQGSEVLSITGQHAGPSSAATPSSASAAVLADAERAIRGTGFVARQRVDRQAQAALLLAEADQLAEIGQRWEQVRQDQADAEVEPVRTRTTNPLEAVDDWNLHVAADWAQVDSEDATRRHGIAPAAIATRLVELNAEIRRRQSIGVWSL